MWQLLVILATSLGASGDAPHQIPCSWDSTGWVLETSPATRWDMSDSGGIHWSCPESGIQDSLILLWPGDVGEPKVVDVSLTIEGPAGGTACQVAYVGPDSATGLVDLPYGSHYPGFPGDGLNCMYSFLRVSERVDVPGGPLLGLMIRLATFKESGTPRVHLHTLTAHSGHHAASLTPVPRRMSRGDGVECGEWIVPYVPRAYWRMKTAQVQVSSDQVVVASCPLWEAGHGATRAALSWRTGNDAAPVMSWEWIPPRNMPDTLTAVGYSESVSDPFDSLAIALRLDVAEGGVGIGPATIAARPRDPLPGEIVISEVATAPAEEEFLELTNTLPWPVAPGPMTVAVDGQQRTCKVLTVLPLSSIAIRREDCPELSLPNDRGDVALMWNGHEIDRMSYGPGQWAPTPPPGWSLTRRDSVWEVSREPTPGLIPFSPPPPVGGDSLALAEIFLWPLSCPDRFVEIVNQGSQAHVIDGWALLCEDAIVLPESTLISPGSSFVVDAAMFSRSFALNPETGEVTLVDASGRVIDRVEWDHSPPEGSALRRVFSMGHSDLWVVDDPTPGIVVRDRLEGCEIDVSATPEGRCIQWQCELPDDALFLVYRAPALDPRDRTQVSTLPITGVAPFVFVDIDIDPHADYLYWVVMVGPGNDEDWLGPELSPANGAALRLDIGPPTPNPFRTETRVSYSIVGLGPDFQAALWEGFAPGRRMRLGVYSMNGSLLKELETDRLEEGTSIASWDGTDDAGRFCPPGVYVVSLQVGPYVRSAKVVFAGQ